MSERVMTTHVGSLPRSKAVTDVVFGREQGQELDEKQAAQTIAAAVTDVVGRQREVGVDIVSDGEMSKISYATYIKDRITGFDGDSEREPPKDLEEFPAFLKRQASSGGTPTYRRPCCVGAIKVKDMAPLEEDLANLAAAVKAHPPQAAFMNAASPGVLSKFVPNHYYKTEDAYIAAMAQAMKTEYEAIHAAGYYDQRRNTP